MSLKRNSAIAAISFLIAANSSTAQVCHNLYPYAEGIVDDNNGHDLKAFIGSNKRDFQYRADKIQEFSSGSWGYLQVGNAKVPSLDKDGNMNFSEYINATLALYKGKDGAEATWWARQCGMPKGALVYQKTDGADKLGVPVVRYSDVTHDLESKSWTLVEYTNDVYNQYDYDELVKNYILVKEGTVKDVNDYRQLIPFYDDFLKRFTYVEDPLLETKSFITLLMVGGNRYVGYFNVVNSKLAGRLEQVHLDYEKDKTELVNNLFKHLAGYKVYIYADNLWGMDQAFLNYSRAHENIKIMYRKTGTERDFNSDK